MGKENPLHIHAPSRGFGRTVREIGMLEEWNNGIMGKPGDVLFSVDSIIPTFQYSIFGIAALLLRIL
jgi:hypothetical protein